MLQHRYRDGVKDILVGERLTEGEEWNLMKSGTVTKKEIIAIVGGNFHLDNR